MGRVLLTGINGFVGKNLASYLKPNFEIDSISLRAGIPPKFQINADAVIHLAGIAHDLKNSTNSNIYYQVNFSYTKDLYDLFLKSEATHFIFISSVKAAADKLDGALDEDYVPNPATDYGKSKLQAENYIQQQPLPEGKFFYILRPCMIHGAGNKGNLNLLYQFVKRNIPYPLGAYENHRSFLTIQNLCFVIQKLIEKNIPSGIYNIADDRPLSTLEVVKILAKSNNRTLKVWNVPTGFINFFVKIGDMLKLPFNSEKLNKLTENFVVNNHKIKKALEIELPLNSIQGMQKTARSFSEMDHLDRNK